MSGGIHAWNGLTAEGAPESGMAYFPDSAIPEDLLSLAWKLEDGSRKFYADISAMTDDAEVASLFSDLATAEDHHKASLDNLYNELFGARSEISKINAGDEESMMEGGIKVSDALHWAKGKDPKAILEFSISAEANAYDLYIKLARKLDNSNAKKIFSHLAEEEQKHLERMGALLEQKNIIQ